MRSIFVSMALGVALFGSAEALAQTTPYNPDSNGNGVILTPDLMDLLTLFGQPFTPAPVQVDGLPVDVAVAQLQDAVAAQQATIAALAATVQTLLNAVPAQGPFHWDAASGSWIATERIRTDNEFYAGKVITPRLEARSAHFGGAHIN
jgi:hypothetical protein